MALAAYASLAVICAASLVVGQAILALCGEPRARAWLAGPVGLAAILVVSGIAIKLPGHANRSRDHGRGVSCALSLAILVAGGRIADPSVSRAGT